MTVPWLLLLAGCGGSTSEEETPEPPASTPPTLWFLADHVDEATVQSPLADAWSRRPSPVEVALDSLERQPLATGDELLFLPQPVARDAAGGAHRLEVEGTGTWTWVPARQEVRFAELPSAAGHARPRTPDGRRGVRYDQPIDVTFDVLRLGSAARLSLRCAVRRDVDPGLVPFLSLHLDGEEIHRAKALDWGRVVELPTHLGTQTLTLRVEEGATACPITVATVTVTHERPLDALLWSGPREGGTVRFRAADPPARTALRSRNQSPQRSIQSTAPVVAGTAAVLAPSRQALQVLVDGQAVGSGSGEVVFPIPRDGMATIEVRGSQGPLQGDVWLVQPDAVLREPQVAALEIDASSGARVGRVTLAGDTRRALLMVAGTTLRVPLPPCSVARSLSFASTTLALDEGMPVSAAPLRVSVESGDGTPEVLWQGRATPGPWQSVPVDVPSGATTLVLEVPAGPLTSRLQLVAVGEARLQHAVPPSTTNVLVYLVDTLRADALSCYGGARPTPRLDEFAQDAILFERAQAPAPWTRPSVASLFTGLHYSFHGAGKETGLADELFTLAEHLHDAGLDTAAFVSNAQIHATGLHFAQGFERLLAIDQVLGASDAEHVLAQALPWLVSSVDRPFFAYLHTIDPHMPYEAPKPVLGRYSADYKGLLADRQIVDALMLRESGTLTDADVQYLRDRYDEEVFYSDEQFGRLLDKLKLLGLYENTTIVFLSDHGEEFGEHGDFGHGGRLWDEMLHVPLLIKPAGTDHAKGLRVSLPVSLVDVFPTVGALCGAPLEEGACQGVDRSAQWSEPAPASPTLVLAEEEPALRSILLGDWKLIEEDGSPTPLRLYRLDGAVEGEDLAGAEQARAEELAGRMHGRLQAFREAGFAPPTEVLPLQLDPDELEALRRLGYIDG